MKINTFTT